MRSPVTRVIATGALAAALAGGAMTSSQAITLPVTTARSIAGAAPVEEVVYGWGWRRHGSGGAFAAGLITGGILGLAATAPFYGYGYPYPWYGPPIGYGPYPAFYGYPAYGAYYPPYYRWGFRRAYWGPSYGWGYRRAFWR